MGKRYPIYTRTRGDKSVYVLDYGQVYDPTAGKVRRKQKQFAKRKAAEDERKSLLENKDTDGPSASLLSYPERVDARRALDLLAGQATLTDAASAFIRASNSSIEQITVSAALDHWVESKRTSNRREKTIRDATFRGNALRRGFGDRFVSVIRPVEILGWFDSDCPEGSRKNYRTVFHDFWEYCVKHGWAAENIVKHIMTPAVDQSDPHILTLRDVIRLMRTAERLCPQIVPYFAIGIYAGLRPENELQNLDWENINLDKLTIRVSAATAKRRRKRIVNMSSNLRDWLKAHAASSGKIFSSRRIARRIRSIANVEWCPDIMRHTFGSYHLALHNDVAFTAKQMGHSSSDMILNHYYALVEDRDAKMFWNITPIEVKKRRIMERLDGCIEFKLAAG